MPHNKRFVFASLASSVLIVVTSRFSQDSSGARTRLRHMVSIVRKPSNGRKKRWAMERERHLADSHRLRSLIEKFRDKAYRDSYIAAHTRRFLARQMRKFRGEKSQVAFGDVIGKRQTVVSRLEDPNYGKWTLQTLF